MIVEVAAARNQPVLQEVQRLRRDMEARFDAMDARFDTITAQLDTITAQLDKLIEHGARQDRHLATLMTQVRWLLVGFVVLVILLVVGFGFLFTQ